MNKETKQSIIVGIVAALLVYLCFAFVIWDFNPGNWTDEQRELCAVWMAISFIVCFAIGEIKI